MHDILGWIRISGSYGSGSGSWRHKNTLIRMRNTGCKANFLSGKPSILLILLISSVTYKTKWKFHTILSCFLLNKAGFRIRIDLIRIRIRDTKITNQSSYLPPVQLSDRIHFPHIVDGGGVVGLQNGRLDLHHEVHSPCPGDNDGGVHDHFLDTP
jgi:hypothetical protein